MVTLTRVEPKHGRTAFFSSGPENPHRVERVTHGERFVLAFWFTCDPKREFEIYLDGSKHIRFSHQMRDSIRKRRSEL